MRPSLNPPSPHLGNAKTKTKAQPSFLPQWTDVYGIGGGSETGGVRYEYGETLQQGSWPDFLDLDALAAPPGPVLDIEKMEMEMEMMMEAHFTSRFPPRSLLDSSLPAVRGRGGYMDEKAEAGYGYGGPGWEDIPLDEGWRMGYWEFGLGILGAVLVGFGVGICAGLAIRGILGLE